jgi:hypothetical protein
VTFVAYLERAKIPIQIDIGSETSSHPNLPRPAILRSRNLLARVCWPIRKKRSLPKNSKHL